MKYYLIIGERSKGRKEKMKIRPSCYPLKPIPINEDDIEVAERYSQLVNGIIDRILEDLKKEERKNV